MADVRFSYECIFKYLDLNVDPEGFQKKKKDELALRKSSKFFKVIDGILYYIGGTGK